MINIVSENIYRIIEEKMLKQSSVAKRAGYSVGTFNAMLRGRKQILTEDIVKVCNALGVTPNELFGFEEQNKTTVKEVMTV